MKWTIAVALAACGGSAPPPVAPAMRAAPAATAPLELAVRVFQWNCAITDANGVETQLYDLDPLHLPVGRPIHMKVRNSDGFADLDIEAPGASGHYPKRGGTGELIFTLDHPGRYHWKCPVQEPPRRASHTLPDDPLPPVHPTTRSIVASSPDDFAAYTREHDPTKPENRIALGKRLYERKACNACHSVDGSPRVGPSWAHIWGTQVQGTDGSSRTVDDAFIRESILTPQAFVAAGFPPAMPSFEGQIKPAEIDALVTYIHSLGATP